MKLLKLSALLLFTVFTNIIYAQQIFDLEEKSILEINNSKTTLSSNCYGEFQGAFSVVTTTISLDDGNVWDPCDGNTWEGTVEWELQEDETYKVYSYHNGIRYEDITMGAYFACYGTDSQISLPNGDLFIQNDCATLSMIGASQWGETYTITEQVFNGPTLTLTWQNDYEEAAQTILTRTDGADWLSNKIELCNICSESDSLALVDLYNATDGANWFTPWDLTQPVRNWYGITLNDNCCVVEIDLKSNELFPDLRGNNLQGTLPASLGGITSLEILDLRGNENLGGTIPTEYGNFSNMTLFLLSDCAFTGNIPLELGDLENLEALVISRNQLTGLLPIELKNLSKLTLLSINNNLLEGTLPVEYSELSNLERLWLGGNQLSGTIPIEYGNLPNLISLSLYENQLTGLIPNALGNLENLQFITLQRNNLTGTIPQELADLTNLRYLQLEENQLSGTIPTGFGNSAGLTWLFLNNNQLTGEIPSDLENLPGLTSLYLNDNQLTGHIPANLLTNGNLNRIFLQNNNLSSCYEEDLMGWCDMDFVENHIDTTFFEDGLYFYGLEGYNFTGNPLLPWEGDFQKMCAGEAQIGASCDDGDVSTTDEVIQEDCSCQAIVSTKELLAVKDIQVFPNPISVNQTITIQFDALEAIDFEISIYNTLGHCLTKTMQKGSLGNNTYELASPDIAGVYFIEISSNNRRKTKRFLVQ